MVVFKYPNDPSQRYIKRIIGLPGETIEIEDGKLIISKDTEEILDESSYLSSSVLTQGDVQFSLGEDEYFVLGDNRESSSVSRRWGPLPKDNIVGKVFFRAWPFVALAKFEAPSY